MLTIFYNNKVSNQKIFFYDPINPNEIPEFASRFDIGLACEVPIWLNRRISLTNKLFTYLQSGLAIVFSNTESQTEFSNKYTSIGEVFKNSKDLSIILDNYYSNRDLLLQHKINAQQYGLTELNWEIESKKFIKVIDEVFNHNL